MLLALVLATTTLSPWAELHAADVRVATVGTRLAVGGRARCPGQTLSLGGAVLADPQQYGKSAEEARRALGLGDGPTVTALVPGASSGLAVGDVIVVPPAEQGFARVAAAEDRIAAGGSVVVRRAGQATTVAIAPTTGCASRFQLTSERRPDARADGRYVQLSAGLYDLLQSDDELAAVLAHELAHNVLGHRAALDAAKTSRGLFAGLGRNGQRLRATELEADRLMLGLMADAGYDVSAVVPLWQRLAKRLGASLDGTHPSWRERIAAVQAELAARPSSQAEIPR